MEPTCSIIYENEPMERIVMQLQPKPFTNAFFKLRGITINMVQGLVITLRFSFSSNIVWLQIIWKAQREHSSF